MLETAKKQARRLRDSSNNESPFPSLVVSARGVDANGVFAETQAEYLEPDPSMVDELVNTLRAKKIGIVAHFYMDAQVQGVLAAARKQYEHVFISDSLVMADAAVKMVDAGCEAIAVLGVDFMSENVRAILDDAGKTEAKVYRMAADDIGCSLAEAAQSKSYYAYLDAAKKVIADGEPAAHVIYINTALDTKANANAVVPTVTCTSSNVVQTVLQLAAQVPGVNVFYGPDTYMGGNLAHLFAMMAEWSDDEVRAVHPEHTASSIKALLPKLRSFQDGTCVVHHMFGGDVCAAVEKHYGDAYIAAPFEVPGEMFKLAMRAKRERDMGVVGSTKNILDFVVQKVDEAVDRNLPSGERLSFVLGTETGMVTAIVRAARERLRDAAARAENGECLVECEIVFPVSTDAVTNVEQTNGSVTPTLDGLTIVPGPAGGEGCGADGGCASCPYMKMNSLAALRGVLDKWAPTRANLCGAVRAQEVRGERLGALRRRAGVRAHPAHARLHQGQAVLGRVRAGHRRRGVGRRWRKRGRPRARDRAERRYGANDVATIDTMVRIRRKNATQRDRVYVVESPSIIIIRQY